MKILFPLIVVSCIYSILFSLIRENTLYDDEPTHIAQIRNFMNRNTVIHPRISLIPGYHFVIASAATLLGTREIPHLRAISLAINLLAIISFFLVARKLDTAHALTKTIQFSFLPILFPYQFLLYPEGLMLSLTFTSLLFALTRKYTLTAFFGFLSVLARQTNIVWFVFLHLLCYLDFRQNNLTANIILKKSWLFILGYCIFAVFFAVNKGFAIGTSDVHPNFSIFSGNVFFVLFVSFWLFLPQMIVNFAKVKKAVSDRKWLPFIIILFILIGTYKFSNSHPWNQYPEHLQNRLVLIPFTSILLLKIIFFAVISYSVISLRVTKLISSRYYLLFPFAFLAAVPIWVVGARYSMVFFTFFLLFRKYTSPVLEWAIILIFTSVSLFLFYGYLNQIFYL